ncbi:MAG: CoA transferase [Deltaproteobacteria bacterium]|nr:CoA transferase [Deltaproteobacteria bacterium]MBW2361215.1 CoA transferase [Deltaproteobacteria bacterium]
MQDAALAGMRVVELGSGVAAPFCAKLFGDFGADVVKVEGPGGDVSRSWGPFPGDRPHPEKSGLFFCLNSNKRSVSLDVGGAADREKLLDLISRADLFVEDVAPRQMREWGLDWKTLSAVNPDLVMISITPFGQTGPYADWKGYDLNSFHFAAAGHRYCGRPDESPLKHGTFSASFFGGYVAATWGLAAAAGRERAGSGQHVDVSCAEVVAALFVGSQNIGGAAQDGVFEKRSGVGMPIAAPGTILPCRDGYVWMMALEPGQWNGLRRAMGDPEWARVELFQDMFSRAQNADVIYPLLEQWTASHSKQEIMDLCQAEGCPTTALFSVAEVAEHPHLAAREAFVDLEHAALGTQRTLSAPVRLPDCRGGPRRAAPLLGEHTRAVLDGLERTAACAPREPRALPLAGLRVANFGWGWLGPVAGQTLALLGAEVYKIESRARIDITRTIPPFGGGISDPDRSLQNHASWAGNGSVTLNLKKEEAQQLARQLVAESDVVFENFGPGVMERLNLGYEALRAVRPDIVMVSAPAAGLFGPLKEIRTYGMSLSSITGLDSLTGYCGGPPIPMENAFADPLGGVVAALGALLALEHRRRSGRGQHVDFSQQEGILPMVAPALMDYAMNGRVAGPIGNRHPLAAAAPHELFRCAGEDRWIAIAVHGEEEWRGLVATMGDPLWARTPEFASAERRIANIDTLHERIGEWTRDFDDTALAEELQRSGVAATPVLGVADLLTHPQFQARGTFPEVAHPLGFKETLYGAYVKLSGVAPPVRPGPIMGQDNDRVFKELLGISDGDVRRLVEEQVIF